MLFMDFALAQMRPRRNSSRRCELWYKARRDDFQISYCEGDGDTGLAYVPRQGGSGPREWQKRRKAEEKDPIRVSLRKLGAVLRFQRLLKFVDLLLNFAQLDRGSDEAAEKRRCKT